MHSYLLQRVAEAIGIPKYRVWSHPGGTASFERLRRKTLFMGLSDGARIDILRHANVGTISNEQVALSTQLDSDKWRDLLKKLRKDTGEKEERFAIVYLIDDFMGTGTSFLRFNEDRREWTGKLARFRDSVQLALRDLADDPPFDPQWELCVHHHLATWKAATEVNARIEQATHALRSPIGFGSIHSSFGFVLPRDLPIDELSRKHADEAYTLAETFESNPRSVWGYVQGLTRLSQRTLWQGGRFNLDRAASRLLTTVP